MTPETRRPRRGDGADAEVSGRRTETPYPEDTTDVDDLLAEVRRWETAARLVADDATRTIQQRCLALVEMAFRSRRSPHPAFLEAATWRGCRHFIQGERKVPRNTIDACRRLLRRGHGDCPACRRPLPDHAELDRWRALEHESWRKPA